jgi:hypothetical protein
LIALMACLYEPELRSEQTRVMRIGTWNMQGRSDSRQLEFMAREDCDVWLLTEVPDTFAMAPGTAMFSDAMSPGRAWSAVWARDGLAGLPTIHEAAAFAAVGDVRVCSCVLPWRAARSTWPDEGADLASITRTAIGRLHDGLTQESGQDVVWGGDWNCALEGTDHVGTPAGRAALRALMSTLDLKAPTSGLGHREQGMCSIDHIAVPNGWDVGTALRLIATADGKRLSDHDAYVIDLDIGSVPLTR